MGELEAHTLVLCIIVLIALVAVLSVLFSIICLQTIKLIRVGAEDERLKAEWDNEIKKKSRNKAYRIAGLVVEIIVWIALISVLIFTISVSVSSEERVGDTPVMKTIESTSMASKNEVNRYLVEHDLNNQVGTNDLVFLEMLPSEEEIQLYDIIMYRSSLDDKLVLHRVVEIYEPEDYGTECRMFVFQGDAVPVPDGEYVMYESMMGIYRGKHIPFVGSFIHFMQSPAGYICFALAIVIFVATPIIDARMIKEKKKRLREIGYMDESIGETIDEDKVE